MDNVRESTKESLQSLGIKPIVTPQGEDVRIAGKTKTQASFAFLLHRMPDKSIRVRLEWAKPDDAKACPEITRIAADLQQACAARKAA